MSVFQLKDKKWTGQQGGSQISHHFPGMLNLERSALIFFYGICGIVFPALWAAGYGCLENRKTERGRSGYRQGAEPQQGSPVHSFRTGKKIPCSDSGLQQQTLPQGASAPPQLSGGSLKSHPSQAGMKGKVP